MRLALSPKEIFGNRMITPVVEKSSMNSYPGYAKFKSHLQKSVPIDGDEFKQIITFFSLKRIKKKEYLLRPFEVCKYETYIISGLFQTAIIDDTGKEHALYFPHEDWWVGDFKSFKTGQRSCMQIIALEDAELLQITKESLEKLYQTFPTFERFFRLLNENAAISLQDRIVQNLSANAGRNYQEFRKKYPALRNRLSNKRIASFLGVTPEYFSQIFKNH